MKNIDPGEQTGLSLCFFPKADERKKGCFFISELLSAAQQGKTGINN